MSLLISSLAGGNTGNVKWPLLLRGWAAWVRGLNPEAGAVPSSQGAMGSSKTHSLNDKIKVKFPKKRFTGAVSIIGKGKEKKKPTKHPEQSKRTLKRENGYMRVECSNMDLHHIMMSEK